MVGYNYSRFVCMSSATAKRLQCDLCLQICADAVVTDCHHNYCRLCLLEWIHRPEVADNACPACRSPMAPKPEAKVFGETKYDGRCYVRPNHAFNATIDTLVIKCDNESKGCPFVWPVSSLSSHAKTCPYQWCESPTAAPRLPPPPPEAIGFTPEVKRLIVGLQRESNEWQKTSNEWQKKYKKVKTENKSLKTMAKQLMVKREQLLDKLKTSEE